MDNDIKDLAALRNKIADSDEVIANRELDARLLRNRLEDEHRAGTRGVSCSSQEKAEKAAKADKEYIDFERETIRLKKERDNLATRAESKRLIIDKGIALLNTVGA